MSTLGTTHGGHEMVCSEMHTLCVYELLEYLRSTHCMYTYMAYACTVVLHVVRSSTMPLS